MQSILTNWKTSLAGVVLIIVGILGTVLGIHIPGFTMDAGAAITMGLGLLLAKDGDAATVAKVLIVAFALSLFLPARSEAGDVNAPAIAAVTNTPAKAPASAWLNGYPYASSGPYVGLFTEAGGGPVVASVPGVNPASLTTTTAGIGLAGGYAWGSKSSALAYAIEGKVSATNFNGANQGFSVSGPVSFEGTALVWMPVSVIQNAFATLNIPNPFATIAPFPANQAGLTASNLQAGFGAGFRADDATIAYLGAGSNKVWNFSPKIEFDLMEQMSNASAVREYVETVFGGNGALFGAGQSRANSGTKYLAGVGVYF